MFNKIEECVRVSPLVLSKSLLLTKYHNCYESLLLCFSFASVNKNKKLCQMNHDSNRQKYGQDEYISKLNEYLKELNKAEAISTRRNKEFLADIAKITNHGSVLSEKADRLKKIRNDYEQYIGRVYPRWKQHVKKEEKQKQQLKDTQTVLPKDDYMYPSYSSPKRSSPYHDSLKESLYPDFVRKKIHNWKHDTSLNSSDETPFQKHSHVDRITSLEESYKSNQVYLQNLLNSVPSREEVENMILQREERMIKLNATNFSHETIDSAIRNRSYPEQNQVFLPVLNEFNRTQQLTSQHNISYNNSNVKILPQLLGLDDNGQLVLVPMAAPFQTAVSSFNSPVPQEPMFNISRQSPVGENNLHPKVAKNLQRENTNDFSPVSTHVKNSEGVPLSRDSYTSKTQNVTDVRDHKKQPRKHELSQSVEKLRPINKNKALNMDKNNNSSNDKDTSEHSASPVPQHVDVKHKYEENGEEVAPPLTFSDLQTTELNEETAVKITQHVHSGNMSIITEAVEKSSPIASSPHLSNMSLDNHVEEGTQEEDIQKENLRHQHDTKPQKLHKDDKNNLFLNPTLDKGILLGKDEHSGESSDNDNESNISQLAHNWGIPVQNITKSDSQSSSNKNNSRKEKNDTSLQMNKVNILHDQQEEHMQPKGSSEVSNESIISFSDDGSDFELPSNGEENSLMETKSVDLHVNKQNNNINSGIIKDSNNNSEQELNVQRQETTDDNNLLYDVVKTLDDRFDEPVLFNLLENVLERVQDDESEEVLVLNLETDSGLTNTIIGTAEIEGDLSRFNASEICMAFRYHLKDTMMQRKEVPFINDNLDVSTDFEGDLRDCVQPMYLELWDTLYAFLSSIMDLFEFNPSQVSKIYSDALIPADKKLQDQLCTALTNILAATISDDDENIAEEEQEGEEQDEDKKDDEESTENEEMERPDVSITEDFDKHMADDSHVAGDSHLNDSINESFSAEILNGQKGDLSKTISIDLGTVSEEESSSTVSFDSDGMPVKRSKQAATPKQNSSKEIENEHVEASGKELSMNSAAYLKMREEFLTSPVQDDSEDDCIDNLLGESLGYSRNRHLRMPTKKEVKEKVDVKKKSEVSEVEISELEGLETRNNNSGSQLNDSKTSSQTKIKLKKPGFWDHSDSDSDLDIDEVNKPVTNSNDDDDFDFDFYD
ncbi:ras guanine nucleotide exchange factor R-like [Hydractinia symbiolongicarpus]|uniref:ras guanine nucleotide exchange factor R-like n=1 Tax=Hydractinia symbiolongicarpus TaxID=13093 RepID=UPI00254E96B4|nr:ras guanine nucleotide exchange factor R-like [Hydractinia symbiolongicarpus]